MDALGGIAGYVRFGTNFDFSRQVKVCGAVFPVVAIAFGIAFRGQKLVLECGLERYWSVLFEFPSFYVFLSCLHEQRRAAFDVYLRNAVSVSQEAKPDDSLDVSLARNRRIERRTRADDKGKWFVPGLREA